MFLVISPLLLAGWVALTRIRDYWHHPTDVMAGTALGLVVSYAVRRTRLRLSAPPCAPVFSPAVGVGDAPP